MDKLVFANRSFCFTGKLADLKRTAAEREVRARGGLTTDRVNERLDYLVVGDEASPAWKHGQYGRKIEQARILARSSVVYPQLICESDFTEALALVASVNAGAIDGKIVVCNYSFVLANERSSVDSAILESVLGGIEAQFGCHVTVRTHWASVRADLFGSTDHNAVSAGAVVVSCRLVRQQALDDPVSDFIAAIEHGFEAVPGVDGRLRWFERTEGSADYVRLLGEVPRSLRVPGI